MKTRTNLTLCALGALAVMVLAAGQAQAAVLTWNLAGGGNWDTVTANWLPGPTTFTDVDMSIPEAPVDAVTFDKVGGGTITISADMSPISTTVSAASGTYTFTGGPIDSGFLIKSGAGTLTLNGANTYAGDTTINAGTLNLGNLDSPAGYGTIYLGDSTALGTATATLGFQGQKNFGNPITVQAGSSGTLTLAPYAGSGNEGGQWSGAITLNNNLTINKSGDRSNKLSGDIDGTGNLTLLSGGTGIQMYMSSINNTGSITNSTGAGYVIVSAAIGSNVTTVTQNSTGTMTLSGANDYTGATAVTAGTLSFGQLGSWSQNFGGTPATPTPITVSGAGTTLAVYYGGATDFKQPDVLSLLANTTFNAGTVLGLNTENSGVWGGVNNTLSAVIGGAGAPQNLTKLGNSNLVLTGANTYTGVTKLQGGQYGPGYIVAGVAENPGVSGPFGVPATAAGSIVFNGGGFGWTAANTTDYSARFTVAANQSYIFNPGGQTVTLASALPISGTNNLLHGGSGTLILSGANTYTGYTQVTGQGTLSVSSLNSVGVGNSPTSNLGHPTTIANGTIYLGGSRDTSGQLTYTGGGETTDRIICTSGDGGGWAVVDQSGSGLLKFKGAAGTGEALTHNSGGHSLTLQGSTASAAEISGKITGGGDPVYKKGTGTWIFSGIANSYTGWTWIQNGILAVSKLANVGLSSSLGSPALANATIAIGSTTTTGELSYIGTGSTTNRVINMTGTTGGVILDQSGASGLLKFTSPLTATGAGIKTLTLQGSTAGTGEIAGAIVNSASATSLTKEGTGLWALSGTNLYTGATTVNNGTLLVNGVLNVGSAVAVNSGGTLGGTGTINGPVTVNGGILAPGASPGTLTTGSLVLGSTSNYNWEVNASSNDLISVLGDLTVDSGALVKLTALDAFVPDPGIMYYLFTYTGSLTGEGNLAIDPTSNVTGFVIGYNYDGYLGNQNVYVTGIPEPATMALLAFGGIGMLISRKRRK